MKNTPRLKALTTLVLGLILAAFLPTAAMAATSDVDRTIDLINEERAARGLTRLVEHGDLVDAAQAQASAMASAGKLFHNDDLGSVTTGWQVLGENVGVGSSAAVIHDAFMGSADHKANILRAGYTHVGVGVAEKDGSLWVAEVFMEPIGGSYNGRFSDDDDSVHEGSIEWLAASGITQGCSELLYCPYDVVTRGQMAAFIQRALDLPNGNGDTYSDDNASIFEGAIQALANEGIAEPCAPGKYCPDSRMTREMMAVFLTRALNLPASSTDRFTDDNGSAFEAEIQALARSGITVGCSETQYCPNDSVTREQMATFLMRSFS